MDDRFFQKPILNSPYRYPCRHWELDAQGQPTQQIIETRRGAEFITPIPKPRKRTASAAQTSIVFDEGKGLSNGADPWTNRFSPQAWTAVPEKQRAPPNYPPSDRRAPPRALNRIQRCRRRHRHPSMSEMGDSLRGRPTRTFSRDASR
jgi:type III restriction enzyme